MYCLIVCISSSVFRNNWLNAKSLDKTFSFPDIDDHSLIYNSSFNTLDKLYTLERGLTIKKAYMLNYKCLHPHSLERQNVKLALRVFHSTNSAALRILGNQHGDLTNYDGTAKFIDIIVKFWNIFNVKTTVEGIHKRLPDCYPIRSAEDPQIAWLIKFSSWLSIWKKHSIETGIHGLTTETHMALKHTVDTVLLMIPELFTAHKLRYILLSKFQTDNLEGRFGLYRQLSGCNYLVSVQEVFQSERKLKIKGLLRLFTSSKGVIPISDFIASFSEISKSQRDENFIEKFPYCDMETEITDVSELLCVTGFIAKKTISHTECKKCKDILGSVGKPLQLFVDEKSHKYFDLINRGGLTFPSNFLFIVTQFAYLIFNVCISTLETEFLQLSHQKQTYLGVVVRFITGHENCTDFHSICDSCGATQLKVIMKSLGCFANTLLNNYSKNKCDDISTSKISRKVAKFN